MNLEENKEMCMIGFEEKETKREMMKLYYHMKN